MNVQDEVYNSVRNSVDYSIEGSAVYSVTHCVALYVSDLVWFGCCSPVWGSIANFLEDYKYER